jgi:hypothetical protein
VLNTSSNVGRIGFDGSTITGPNFVMGASSTSTTTSARSRRSARSAPSAPATASSPSPATLETYFGDPSIYQKIINNTLTSFDHAVGRPTATASRCCSISPRSRCRRGSPAVSGKNADVMIQAGFRVMDATRGYTMSVGRFWYLPIV